MKKFTKKDYKKADKVTEELLKADEDKVKQLLVLTALKDIILSLMNNGDCNRSEIIDAVKGYKDSTLAPKGITFPWKQIEENVDLGLKAGLEIEYIEKISDEYKLTQKGKDFGDDFCNRLTGKPTYKSQLSKPYEDIQKLAAQAFKAHR